MCHQKNILYLYLQYEYSDIVQVTFWIPIYSIIAKSHRNYVHKIYNIFYYVYIRYFLLALWTRNRDLSIFCSGIIDCIKRVYIKCHTILRVRGISHESCADLSRSRVKRKIKNMTTLRSTNCTSPRWKRVAVFGDHDKIYGPAVLAAVWLWGVGLRGLSGSSPALFDGTYSQKNYAVRIMYYMGRTTTCRFNIYIIYRSKISPIYMCITVHA